MTDEETGYLYRIMIGSDEFGWTQFNGSGCVYDSSASVKHDLYHAEKEVYDGRRSTVTLSRNATAADLEAAKQACLAGDVALANVQRMPLSAWEDVDEWDL